MNAPFTVAMLAGGASRRMGQDKATLRIGGQELGERVLVAALLVGASEVLAVGGDCAPLQEQGWRHVADLWPGEGPLGGIISALTFAANEMVVVVACDLPDVDDEVLQYLVGECAAHPSAMVVVPDRDGRPEVLHAVWRRGALAVLRGLFDDGERSPTAALARIEVLHVRVAEPSLRDLDTPDDLAQYLLDHPEADG